MFLTETSALDDLDPMRAALGLAEACSLAYNREEARIESIANRWEWQVLDHFRRGASGALPSEDWGFAARGQNALILIFRGADSLADWLRQDRRNAEQVDGFGGVHGGMLAEFNALRPTLERLGGLARDDGLPIWCAGHGLGGAMALLTAASFADQARLVTFGQPRITDAAAAERTEAALDGRYWRFVNHDDLVPRVPPGFHHCGLKCAFDLSGVLHRGGKEDPALDPAAYDRLAGRIAQIHERTQASRKGGDEADLDEMFQASLAGLVDGVLSHRIDSYVDALRLHARRIGEPSDDALTVAPEAMPLSYRLAAREHPDRVASRRKPTFEAGADAVEDESPPAPDWSFEADPGDGGGDVDDWDAVEVEAAPGDGGDGDGGWDAAADEATPEDGGGEGDWEAAEVEAAPGDDGDDEVPGPTAGDGAASAILIPAVVDFAPGWAPDPALKVLSKSSNRVATVMMTSAQHAALRRDQNVNRIEISRDAGFAELKSSLAFTRGEEVHRPPLDERGDRCIFALIDTGIDILHEAFSDGNGGCRVRAIWHQADTSGQTPQAVDPKFKQDYGRLYTADELDRMVREARTKGTPLPDVLRDDVDLFSSGHGTHVASIGAGRPFGTLPGGIAPDAPIVAVIPNLHTDKSSPTSLGYSLSHVDAVEFLSTMAMQASAVIDEALPMVVNVSLGMNAGPHDGKTPLEVAFGMATRDGTRPGFAIVKSAGNEAGEASHARTRLLNNSRSSITWTSANTLRPHDYIELWWDSGTDFRFKLFPPGPAGTPQTHVCVAVEGAQGMRNGIATHSGNAIQLTLVPQTGSGNQLIIEIAEDGGPILPGTWTLDIFAHDIGQTDGVIDAWAERIFGRTVAFDNADNDFTISIPGTVRSVVCVGATDCNPFTAIGPFSSRGLTRDKIAKPDLTAPGVGIEAARAGLADHAASQVRDGTSMAAPHVGGAMALVLSQRQKAIETDPQIRQFTADQLRQAAIATARDPAHHQLDWGHGKLDVKAFYEHMLTI